MTITEIRDALTQLIDAGHGKQLVYDDENFGFAVCGIIVKQTITADGDPDVYVAFDYDEVR